MNEYPSRLADKIMVRLPDGWRDGLKELAKANRRSVNAEVLVHLGNVLGFQDKTAAGKSLQASPAAASEQAALAGGAHIQQA